MPLGLRTYFAYLEGVKNEELIRAASGLNDACTC